MATVVAMSRITLGCTTAKRTTDTMARAPSGTPSNSPSESSYVTVTFPVKTTWVAFSSRAKSQFSDQGMLET